MKPDNWTLVRGSRQLLTLHHLRGPRRAGELAGLGVIPDGSVLLRNGVIEAVGPTRRIENMAGARDADEINAAGRVVMPAFIDCHACLVPVPAYQGAAARTVQALPANRLEAQADDLLKVMSCHGTATIGALSGYGVDSTGELKILRALRALNKKPLDIISILFVMEESRDDQELLHCVARRKLATVAQVRCGNGGRSLPAAEAFLELARSSGLALRVEMLPGHDAGLVAAAVAAQALSISSAGPFSKPEIELLSYSSTFAILLPAISSPDAPGDFARKIIDDGGLVALGSGIGPETGGTASMQTVIQLACERLGLTIAEAISATTINAAWAMGAGSRTGSLESGKRGDLILLNASDYREIPLLAGTNLTHSMIKRGVVVFKEDFPGWPPKG
jgi:imidazolonepropionase